MHQPSLLEIVRQTRRLWNWRTAIELVSWLIAGWFLALLVVGVLDYVLRSSDPGMRILLTVALAAVVVAVGWTTLRRWRRLRWSDFRAASYIQQTFPQLGDRLASAIEFLRQDEGEGAAGSLALRRAVVLDTTSSLAELSVTDAARLRSPTRAILAAILSLLTVGALAIAFPEAVKTAVSRVVLPWSDAEWPRRHSLQFVDPPKLLAKGETFETALIDANGNLPEEVVVDYRYRIDGRRRTDTEPMQRVGDTLIARREKVMRDFEFRARGGDHQSMAWIPVKVVDPPSLESFSLVIHPPEYSGLKSFPVEGPARVLSGSTLTLTGKSNVPLAGANLESSRTSSVPLAIGDSTSIELSPGTWLAELKDGGEHVEELRVRMQGADGLIGYSPPSRLRIVDDSAPQVVWQDPQQDLQLVATAILPISVKASDNLAIASVSLDVTIQLPPSEVPLPEGDIPAPSTSPKKVSLYSLESPPPLDSLPATGTLSDTRQLVHELSLAELQVPEGSIVLVEAVATDFRPGEGRTPNPRRLTIISLAELESRIAAEQAEILRRIRQSLEDQRKAKGDSEKAAATTPHITEAIRERIDALGRARTTQQKVRRQLVAPVDGVIALVDGLQRRLSVNQLVRPELISQLNTIRDELNRLEAKPLPEADQWLTDIRRQLDASDGALEAESRIESIGRSLSDTQNTIIEVLEKLVEEAAAWSDAEGFVRELAQLHSMQRELAESTAKAALRQAQAQSRQQALPQEEVDRLAARQREIARRTEKLLETMRDKANSSQMESDFTQRLDDAVQTANRDQLTNQMAAAARDSERRQLGRAAEAEQHAADTLEELLNLLRNTTPTQPGEIANELRKLAQQLAQLQRELGDGAAMPDEEREALANRMSQAARQLNRLTAPAASQSTQQAAADTAPQSGETRESRQQRDQQAQQNLQQAQRELAQRIDELEQQRQQRLLERLAVVLEELIPQQQEIIAATIRLDDSATADPNASMQEGFDAAAADQKGIANALANAIEDLEARAVFQVSLRGAEGDMRQAAQSLSRANAGHLTQQLELAALARMQHVLDVLREPPPEPENPENPQDSDGGQGNQGNPQQRRPPVIELAEAKMLRWLQVELNGRTRLYEAELADNPQARADKQEIARRLADEQQQLEALVREMMQRASSPEKPLEQL